MSTALTQRIAHPSGSPLSDLHELAVVPASARARIDAASRPTVAQSGLGGLPKWPACYRGRQ